MKPPLAATALFGLVLCLSACGKQEPPPRSHAGASPSPGPTNELDQGVDTVKKKTDEAVASVDKYLQEQSPQIRERFDKAVEKFNHDKAHWREKLQARKKELQPQIDQLKARLGKVDAQTRDQLTQELARLQDQSVSTDQKLAELEASGQDAWKSFKARLKEEEVKNGFATPAGGKDKRTTPTPTPSR